jgi:hypothetical protein
VNRICLGTLVLFGILQFSCAGQKYKNQEEQFFTGQARFEIKSQRVFGREERITVQFALMNTYQDSILAYYPECLYFGHPIVVDSEGNEVEQVVQFNPTCGSDIEALEPQRIASDTFATGLDALYRFKIRETYRVHFVFSSHPDAEQRKEITRFLEENFKTGMARFLMGTLESNQVAFTIKPTD